MRISEAKKHIQKLEEELMLAKQREAALDQQRKDALVRCRNLSGALLTSHEWIRRLKADRAALVSAAASAVRENDLRDGRSTLEALPGHELLALPWFEKAGGT